MELGLTIPVPDLDKCVPEGIMTPPVHRACSSQSLVDSVTIGLQAREPFQVITPTELKNWLQDPTSHPYDQLLIADARFDYEFAGGRIYGAKNITSRDAMAQFYNKYLHKNVCIVFHCEFSANRGPTLMRRFRDYDRKQNLYPNVSYPDIFLLEGGYSRFYDEYPEMCSGGYVKMRDEEYIADLKRCHSDYTRDMLQDRRTAGRRRYSAFVGRSADIFGFGSLSDESLGIMSRELSLDFTATQPV